jgi:hypothetical protein
VGLTPSPSSLPSIPRGVLAPIPEVVGVVLSEAICQRGERITTMHMSFFANMLFYSANQFITSMTTTTDHTTHERFLLKCPQTP